MANPALPPGFVLEDDDTPPLPPGFVVEQPKRTAAAQVQAKAARPKANDSQFAQMVKGKPKKLSIVDAAKRELGLGARGVIRGVYDLSALFGGDLLNYAEQQVRGVPMRSQRENADWIADKLGLPAPETGTERVGGEITAALTGGGGLLGGGRVLASRTPGIVQGVGEALSSMPRTQIASAAGGSGASGVTRESGGGTGAQITAGLIGGLGPAAALSGGSGAVRVATRGGEQGRKAMASRTADFKKAGTTPTVGQASNNRAVRAIETFLGRVPGGAGVISQKAQQQGEEIGAGVQALADRLAPRADAESAGRAIIRGINGPGDESFMARTGRTQERLYGRLDQEIDPASRVSVNATRSALPEINPTIPGAPEISRMFQNSRIQGIERGLANDTEGLAGVMSRPGVAEWADELRGSLQAEADQIAAQNAQRRALMLPDFPVPTPAQIDEQVMGRVAALADGRLPYEALKKTRTLVGREIQDAGIAPDVPRSKWNPLYGALSDDMRNAADAAGPAARTAFERANRYTRAKAGRQESIAHVVDANGGPERIFQAALSGTKDGATTLRALMRSLPSSASKEVAAAVLNRIGRATSGNQNAEGTAFSTQTFLTNWDKFSPQARAALFDSFGPEFRARVEAITRVASNLRDGSKVYANPSGTSAGNAQNITYGALGASAIPALGGNPWPLMGVVGGIAANNGLARLLTNPRYVDWLARPTQTPYGVLAPSVLSAQSED